MDANTRNIDVIIINFSCRRNIYCSYIYSYLLNDILIMFYSRHYNRKLFLENSRKFIFRNFPTTSFQTVSQISQGHFTDVLSAVNRP